MSERVPAPRGAFTASHALMSAALGGLLCLGTACSSSNNAPASSGSGGAPTGGSGGSATGGTGGGATGGSGGVSTGGSGGSATGGTGGGSTGGTGGSSTGGTGGGSTGGTGGSTTDGGSDASADAATDASDAAAYVYCTNAPVDVRTVTSQMTVAMTQAEFQALCSSNGGTFEIMPHCGGFNSCMGISYDTGTQVLSQHTCRGLNTCAGYSCVICGDAGAT